jgi:hypothetical protein
MALPLLFKPAPGTAMLRLTVAFIVVTLAGLPVLPIMCHAWCGQDKTTREYCHDEAVENGSPTVTAGAMCSSLVPDNPFIGEDARPVLHTVHQIPARKTISTLSAAAHTFLTPGRVVNGAAPAPPLVLRV